MSTIKVNTIQANTTSTLSVGSLVPSLDVTGSVTVGGSVIGDVTGNVTGDVTGNLTGTASTATAAATAYGLSGSPTLSGITSVSTTNLTVNGNAYPSAGPLSNRNLIINGAMQVAQRGTSQASVTSTTYAGPDRFQQILGTAGTWTVSQSTETPEGFTTSLKLDCTTANASLSASSLYLLGQKIEGLNVQHLDYNTVNAKTVTLSFWVRSNKTGTYVCEVTSATSTRKISQTYTINSANTWEKKILQIPGDTGGSLPNSNTAEFNVYWWIVAGTNYTSGTLNTTWGTPADSNRVVGQTVNLADSTDNDFYLTGVQLEVGSVATPFEHRSYGQELALCQRYYKQIFALQGRQNQSFFISNYGNTNAVNIIEAGLYNMRANANVSLGPTGNTGNVQYYSYGGTWTSSTLTVSTIGIYPYQQIYLYATADGDGRGKLLRRSGASDPDIYVEISAEL